MISRRELARRLEAVVDFASPAVELEQYLTPAALASHLVHLAAIRGDLAGQTVVDLGTGTGMLALGAAFGSPARVIGVDVDRDALELARRSERHIEPARAVDWLHANVTHLPLALSDTTVVSNPPFGAQQGNRHADRAFLETAATIGTVSYTIHNGGSLKFLEAFAADNGGTVTDAFQAPIDLERQFSFHEKSRQTLEVEVARIEWD